MTRPIAEWSRLAHELAREKGEHGVVCDECEGEGGWLERMRATDGSMCDGRMDCGFCETTGRVEADHKSPTRIASRLALIHLAISRAVECVVKGEMEVYWVCGGNISKTPQEENRTEVHVSGYACTPRLPDRARGCVPALVRSGGVDWCGTRRLSRRQLSRTAGVDERGSTRGVEMRALDCVTVRRRKSACGCYEHQ